MTPRRPLAWAGALVLLVTLGGCLTVPVGDERRVDAGVNPVSGESCNAPARADTSEAALAYMAAIDAADPGWRQVDANIRATGGAHRDDLPLQVDADRIFLEGLRAIEWPADAAPTAADLIAVVEAYDEVLMTGYDQHGYLAEHQGEVAQINETRADTSHRLRDLLGLEQSRCSYSRP